MKYFQETKINLETKYPFLELFILEGTLHVNAQ